MTLPQLGAIRVVSHAGPVAEYAHPYWHAEDPTKFPGRNIPADIANQRFKAPQPPLASVTRRVFGRSQRAGLVSRNAFACRNSGCPHTVVGVFTPRRPAFGSAVSRMTPVFFGRTSSGFHMTTEPSAVHTVWTQDFFRCPSSHVGLKAVEERGEQLGSLWKTRS